MKTNTTGRLQEAKRISKVSEGSQSTMNRKLGLPKKISLKLNKQFALNTELYTPKGDMTARHNPESSIMNFDRMSYNYVRERPQSA